MNNKGADQTARMPGWSAPLLFAYGKSRFSHDMAHICPNWEIPRNPLKSFKKVRVGSNNPEHGRVTWNTQLLILIEWGLLPIWNSQNCSMFPLAFVAGWLQGHWWSFISRNYVVWPTFFLMNVFIALKGSHFWFYIWLHCSWCCAVWRP